MLPPPHPPAQCRTAVSVSSLTSLRHMESVIFHLNTVRQATLAMGGEMGVRRPHGGRDGEFGAHYNKMFY